MLYLCIGWLLHASSRAYVYTARATKNYFPAEKSDRWWGCWQADRIGFSWCWYPAGSWRLRRPITFEGLVYYCVLIFLFLGFGQYPNQWFKTLSSREMYVRSTRDPLPQHWISTKPKSRNRTQHLKRKVVILKSFLPQQESLKESIN